MYLLIRLVLGTVFPVFLADAVLLYPYDYMFMESESFNIDRTIFILSLQFGLPVSFVYALIMAVLNKRFLTEDGPRWLRPLAVSTALGLVCGIVLSFIAGEVTPIVPIIALTILGIGGGLLTALLLCLVNWIEYRCRAKKVEA